MKRIGVALFTLAATLSVGVQTQDKDNPQQVGFGVNSVDIRTPKDFGGVLRDQAESSGSNIFPTVSRLSVGRYIGEGSSVELSGSLNKIGEGYGYNKGLDNKIDQSFWTVNLAAQYHLNTLWNGAKWFDPYVQVGGGYVAIDNEDKFHVLIGAGTSLRFTDNIGLNLQTTYRPTTRSESTESYFQHVLRITIKFGKQDRDSDGVADKDDKRPDVTDKPEPNGCLDADGDGITDAEDSCPDVFGLKEFNGRPNTDGDGIADEDDECPEVAGKPELRGRPDADNDGTADKDDKHPQQAGPKEDNGCPQPGGDGDSVLGEDDECPEEAGPASSKGCPEMTQEIQAQPNSSARTILSDIGKSTIRPRSAVILSSIVNVLNKYKNSEFLVEGYTGTFSNKNKNQRLSEDRTCSVKTYLVDKGINSVCLFAEDFDLEKPITSSKTKKGGEPNRHVEINLVK